MEAVYNLTKSERRCFLHSTHLGDWARSCFYFHCWLYSVRFFVNLLRIETAFVHGVQTFVFIWFAGLIGGIASQAFVLVNLFFGASFRWSGTNLRWKGKCL